MRISRRKKPKKPLIPKYSINEKIRADEVRVLDNEGEHIGVMPLQKALDKAHAQELDLVEINPAAEPPVVQISNFAHFKYQKEKEARKQKAKAHVSELKGVRLSIRIGEHDLQIRQKQAEKFLDRGDKARIEIILRGRERAKANAAYDVIRDFVGRIEENMEIKYEQEPDRRGNKVTAIISKK